MNDDNNQWPDIVICETAGCGRKIKTKVDSFSVVMVSGNVLHRKGMKDRHDEYVNGQYVICSNCSRKTTSKYKRRNKVLSPAN